MKSSMKIKMIVDILMTFLLFAVMSFHYTGEKNHEILGTVLLALFILHHALNFNWYKSLKKGKYQSQRIVQTAVDVLLLCDMIGLMVSGIGMSRYVFRFLELDMSMMFARNLHMVATHAGFLLMGFHIGLHYTMILGMVRKALHLTEENKARTRILTAFACVLAGYGVYALIKRNFLSYIILSQQFAFFDYEEPIIFYEMDLLAMLILMVFAGFYIQKLVTGTPKTNRR